MDNSTGNYSISFLDLAGNQGNQVSGPTYPIIVDTEVPVLEMVSIYSNNLDNQTAKLNDLVTLKFRSSKRASKGRKSFFMETTCRLSQTMESTGEQIVGYRFKLSEVESSLDIYFEDHAGSRNTD